ncbi:hypothetical protein RB597_001177 [Gaeumannomyces tritici]
MDPITAIGAASSVIGIAAFAIELCEVLHEFGSQVRGAREGLLAVSSSIESTADSLRLIHQYLDMEADNLSSGGSGGPGSTRLFSKDALAFVKSNADRCLLVFWRIEAVMLNGSDDGEVVEAQLRRRLDEFNAGTEPGRAGKVAIELSLVPASLPLLRRLRWPLVTAKLAEYRSQLQFHQQCLSLIIMTVFIGEVRSKPSLENKDINAIAKAAVDINKASREVKGIMRSVASIREMLQEGDIDLRVLFPPRELGGPPPYYRKSAAEAHEEEGGGTGSVLHQPTGDLANGTDVGSGSYSQSTQHATLMAREPGVGASSSGVPLDSSRNSFALSQTSGKAPLASNILNLSPQTNLEPRRPTAETDGGSSEFHDPPKKQDLPIIAPLLRPATAGAGGESHGQNSKRPVGGDYEGTTDTSGGASVKSVESLGAADPEQECDGLDGQGAADSEANDSSDDDSSSSDSSEEATSALELGFRKYRNGVVSRYMIKQQGTFFALEPMQLKGLRRAMEALRWRLWPSKEAMERTLASATEDQLSTLGHLLQRRSDVDGEIFNRSLLQVREVGRKSGRAGPSVDSPGDGGDNGTALLVLVEMLPRDRFASISESDGKISGGGAGHQGAWIQDLSTGSDQERSLVFLLTTHHVWRIQPQESSTATGAGNPDWSRCLVTRGRMSEEEVIQLRGPIDENNTQEKGPTNQPPGLTPDQRSQVDRLMEQLQTEAAGTKFAYSVEKVEAVRADKPQGVLRAFRRGDSRAGEISALLVFFARGPRDGVNLGKLYRAEQRRRKTELRRPGLPFVQLPQIWEPAPRIGRHLFGRAERGHKSKGDFEEPGSPVRSDTEVALRGDGEARKRGTATPRPGPTYTSLPARDLELETLRALSIEFELDRDDPNHIIINRVLDEEEQKRLLAHTRAIREARQAGADAAAGPSIQADHLRDLLSTPSDGAHKMPASEPESHPEPSLSVNVPAEEEQGVPKSIRTGISGHRIAEPASTASTAGEDQGGASQGGLGLGKEGEWANPEAEAEAIQDGGDWDDGADDDDDDLVERLLARWTPAGEEEWRGSVGDTDEVLGPVSGAHTPAAKAGSVGAGGTAARAAS